MNPDPNPLLNSRKHWTPIAADWATISGTPGVKYWTVYARHESDPADGIVSYWSILQQLTIAP